MKKNIMMRVASALLIAVLLTTCAISGTFAKYVTTTGSSDNARVAKWGFEPESMDITNLFTDVYTSVDGQGTDLIAPGTEGSAQFVFAYDEDQGLNAPEVAYTFKVDTTGSEIADDIKANENIQWKLDSGDYGTWDQLIASIKELSGDADGECDYAPNTLPDAFSTLDNTHTIYWRWVFTTGNDSDVEDTTMGNAEALGEVVLVINITATQKD